MVNNSDNDYEKRIQDFLEYLNNKNLNHLQKWLLAVNSKIKVRNAIEKHKPIINRFVFELNQKSIGRRCNYEEAKAFCVGVTYARKELGV